jgi:hypothetical protein
MTNIDTIFTDTASMRSPGRASLAGTARNGARPGSSKSALVMKMLTRARGATIVEVTTATDWQPHSVRAHFSGLRKKGVMLVREARKSGEGAYRVDIAGAPATDPVPVTEDGPVDATNPSNTAPADIAAA